MSENDIHTLTITVNTSSKCGVVPPQARYHLLRVCEREQPCMCPRLCTKHELLRVWNPLWSSYCHWTLRQKISSRNYLPLNTLKHIKHGCLRCSSMMPFIAGLRNERPAVQRDNATSGAIITQVCGWDEGSKKASATGVPLRRRLPCCQKKKRGQNTGLISPGIKCGLRINEFLNTQHHLHKKQQAGYVGGLVCFS